MHVKIHVDHKLEEYLITDYLEDFMNLVFEMFSNCVQSYEAELYLQSQIGAGILTKWLLQI